MKSSIPITIEDDPNLDRIWTTIGLAPHEKKQQMAKLEEKLFTAYSTFVSEESAKCEALRLELRDKINQFQALCKVYGINAETPSITTTTSFSSQIQNIQNIIDNTEEQYEPRKAKFYELFEKLADAFEILQAGDIERGDFSEVGDQDLTLERLEKASRKLQSLEEEIEKRQELCRTIGSSIKLISAVLSQSIDENVESILEENSIDNDSIKILRTTLDDLVQTENERRNEIEYLTSQIHNLSVMLGKKEKGSQKVYDLSIRSLDDLHCQFENLNEEIEKRYDSILANLKSELSKLYLAMRYPQKQRLKYIGLDKKEELHFYQEELKKVQNQYIMTQPILDAIFEMEEAKEKRIDSTRIEKKLLKLLIDFKDENGFDFEYNGQKYIDVIQNIRVGKTKTPLGKALLRSKLQSQNTRSNKK